MLRRFIQGLRAIARALACLALLCPAGGAAVLAGPVGFRRDVQPLLADHCLSCHGPEKQKGGLRLDRNADAMKGGESGPSILPGKGEESRLFRAVAGLEKDSRMPPKGEPLTAAQVALLKQWIDEGASWPETGGEASPDLGRSHWAFKAPARPAVPEIGSSALAVRNPIDAFVAKEQIARGLTPAPEAEKRVLVRRLFLDLTGLPPSVRETEEFMADTSADAYDKLVERVLKSPHYGERWGRFWLDLARWAESDGYEANEVRASAWLYRDYVVRSFNEDKPYDRFLLEQIAGDELEPYSDENLIATGFLAGARLNNNEEDKAVQLNEPLVDMVNMVGSVTLGLTLGCAQCHDHKFEPVSARDYYALHGFFIRGQVNSLFLKDEALVKAWERQFPPELEASRQKRRALWASAEAHAKEEAESRDQPADLSPEKVKAALPESDRKTLEELDRKISNLEREHNGKRPQTWGFYSPVASPHRVEHLTPRGMFPLPYKPEVLKTNQPFVLKRGDVHKPTEKVEPGVPAVLLAGAGDKPVLKSRADLARWLTGEKSPLTARVWANLVWQQHFGRGLVETPGDFGTHGGKPSHPELLDWLATELRGHDWSSRHIHRLIVKSATYRQASRPNRRNESLDPDNRWLWRWTPRRLEGEAIRDSILAVSGELDAKVGGASIPLATDSRRRSLYSLNRRYHLSGMQALFDSPTANESCPRRNVSTVPLQPLHLLNDEGVLKRAEAFAARVAKKAGDEEAKQIETAFNMALGRGPDTTEFEHAFQIFEPENPGGEAAQPRKGPSPPLVRLCHALFNLNEFVYLE